MADFDQNSNFQSFEIGQNQDLDNFEVSKFKKLKILAPHIWTNLQFWQLQKGLTRFRVLYLSEWIENSLIFETFFDVCTMSQLLELGTVSQNELGCYNCSGLLRFGSLYV